MKKSLITAIIGLTAIMFFYSCKKTVAPANLVASWTNFALKTTYENPAPAGRTETGTITIELYDDNTVKWSATIVGLTAGDVITGGHIHAGDATTNGPVIVNFNPSFSATGTASGSVSISSTLADSLKTKPIYVNFHSTAFPGGLIRAQLDKTIDVAFEVNLTGGAEVPAVVTTATGKALLRLMSDKTLYYKVTVSNLEAADALAVSHIHKAAAGVNGSVFINLIAPADATQFGLAKSIVLDDTQILSLKTDAIYVNAHSTMRPGGVVRGQIR